MLFSSSTNVERTVSMSSSNANKNTKIKGLLRKLHPQGLFILVFS